MGKKHGKHHGKKIVKKSNRIDVETSKTSFHAKQTATAFVGQGGNSFAINANELGVIRVRP
ncbi:hypothetical protein [Paenibacillus methanolicus]|uniref:Uncharacterized protein n=1 Tax=Paenibacillus methanolicus TaxID=582686 RepID=A0A5S5CHV7_9BACL|nr:hypothetical protein [Paenibacillus methanolicus]TYP78082.1 hypothetical protein BCM02_102659 [Paenibacillus methanolicus]